MNKFGLYDPASIRTVADGVLAINFINAEDADDVSTIEMRSRDEVQTVIDRLDDQVDFRMSSMGPAKMEKIAGVIRMNQEEPGFGMMIDSATNQRLPVRLAFGVTVEDLPENGICMAMGVRNDGALNVYKMAVRPVEPGMVTGLEIDGDKEEPYP